MPSWPRCAFSDACWEQKHTLTMQFVCVRLWSVLITDPRVRKYKIVDLLLTLLTEEGDRWKPEVGTSTRRPELLRSHVFIKREQTKTLLQNWFSLTCAIATNLLFLLNVSLRNQRRNFLLCLQMTTLLWLLREFSSAKVGLLWLPFQPCMKESPSR